MILEEERERLGYYEEMKSGGSQYIARHHQQRKLVHALEQLEHAREALEYCRDESTDIWIGRKAEAALEALKQHEVG